MKARSTIARGAGLHMRLRMPVDKRACRISIPTPLCNRPLAVLARASATSTPRAPHIATPKAKTGPLPIITHDAPAH
eukprot:6191962-Pleurochrysis_carterae.AAC.6